jgi:hypothetical protein
MMLNRVDGAFEAEMIGMTDDPHKLEPLVNEAGAEYLLAQIG